jgi:predicted  nucleic acid-binding Zn-ribbon protein
MQRAINTVLTIGLLVFMAVVGLAQTPPAAPGQEAENPAVLLQQLRAEVKKCRLEVVEQGIEFQQWKIKQLEREFQRVQSERQRLGEQEQSINQRIAELDSYAASAGPGQEGEVEESKAIKATISKGLKKLQTQQQPISEREAELAELLGQEQQRLEELLKKARQLKAEN